MGNDNKQQEMISFYDAISKNNRNSVILFIVVFLILFGLVYLIAMTYSYVMTGYVSISLTAVLVIILPLAVFIILIEAIPAYYYGDRIILKDVEAYKPDPVKHIHLINLVEGLSLASGLPKPQLYIIPSKEINAFATGRNPEHASIAVTEGALEKLDRKELEGVLGHEFSHIKNYDIRYTLIVAAVVGIVAIISQMFLRSFLHGGFSGGSDSKDNKGGAIILVLIVVAIIFAIIAPILVRMIQLAVSRQREYLADASGVEITRNPRGLAGALQKIKENNKRDMQVSEAVSHLFIDDPKNTFADNIFETHPPLDDRINRLKAMGG